MSDQDLDNVEKVEVEEKKGKQEAEVEEEEDEQKKVVFDEDEEIETRIALKSLPCTQVIVFKDRAELTRPINIEIKAGKNRVVVYGFTENIDKDTARVKGATGSGATLLEVTYNEAILSTKEKEYDESIQDKDKFEAALKALEKEDKQTKRAQDRVELERAWIEGWAKTIRDPAKSEDVMSMMSSASFSSVTNFLAFYRDRLAKVDARKDKITKELKRIAGEIDHLKKSRGKKKELSREIHITVLARKDTKITLPLQYLMTGASWSAEYNLRVDSESEELQVQYFGMISNKTGENWDDTRVFLSTALPSAGGKPPELSSRYISLQEPRHRSQPNSRLGGGGAMTNMAVRQTAMVNPMYAAPALAGGGLDDFGGEVEVSRTIASKGSTSTTFEIPRTATIPFEPSSDRKHKVTIGIMTFSAKFVYTTIPALDQKAYLRADVTHTGGYIILPGPYRVFMDNNLVSKSQFTQVCPGEEFTVFLGADDAIKVEFNPLNIKKGTTGIAWINKANQKETIQEFVVTNLKAKPQHVFVYNALPQSTDNRIKVKCVEPPLEVESKQYKQTELGNLEWHYVIKPNEKQVIRCHYVVAFPKGHVIIETN